jgi:hypothetical protein
VGTEAQFVDEEPVANLKCRLHAATRNPIGLGEGHARAKEDRDDGQNTQYGSPRVEDQARPPRRRLTINWPLRALLPSFSQDFPSGKSNILLASSRSRQDHRTTPNVSRLSLRGANADWRCTSA